jgi:hypothetical protein
MDHLPITLPGSSSSGLSIFFSILFGLIGTGYFMYGKKNQKYPAMFVGIALGVYPYFITNAFAVILIGIALMLLPAYMKD